MNTPIDQIPPFRLFGGVPDEAWGWLHLEGRDQCPFLTRYLPGLTDDPDLEARAVGSSGDQALVQGFQIYELFKALSEKHGRGVAASSSVLDFGCGWGRVIRFFLKDVTPQNLLGIDVNEKVVEICRRTNQWCRFQPCERLPPSGLETDSFDLIYAFSVFSHLSEEAHALWLDEFERLLKPGGVLLLTTFPRALLATSNWSEVVDRFSPVEPWLSAYDRGEYCYVAEAEANPHFGTAFIPEQYVREHWTKHFDVREYFKPAEFFQNVIACTKPG
jgi:SAM-dependent methyltransferase